MVTRRKRTKGASRKTRKLCLEEKEEERILEEQEAF